MTKMTVAANGQVVRDGAARKQTGLAGLLDDISPELARALPRHLSIDRMARLALTALRTTRNLVDCTPASFAASVMNCAVLGLEPNTPLGQAYLIPRKNRKTGRQECTLLVGYQGYLDLARRSGQVAGIVAYPVFDGDVFEYELGLEPKLRHVPKGERDQRKLTHAYAVCRLKDRDADPIFVVLSRAEIEQRRDRGGYGSSSMSPWKTDFIAMAQKSAVRALFTWMPRSAEMARAVSVEEAHDSGRSTVAELPDSAVAALLDSGAADESEIIDVEPADDYTGDTHPGELDADMREPGED